MLRPGILAKVWGGFRLDGNLRWNFFLLILLDLKKGWDLKVGEGFCCLLVTVSRILLRWNIHPILAGTVVIILLEDWGEIIRVDLADSRHVFLNTIILTIWVDYRTLSFSSQLDYIVCSIILRSCSNVRDNILSYGIDVGLLRAWRFTSNWSLK